MLKYEGLKAKDLIKQAIIIEPSQTLYDVRSMMIRYNISRVVIAKDNKPLGIITEKDIARFLYEQVPNRRLNEVSVNEITSKDLIKVEQQTNLDICGRTMLEKKISSVVVVDNEGVLKGIITKSDMVEAYARHYPRKLKVDQYMTKKVITVAPDENLHMILFGTGVWIGLLPGGYWTSQEELVTRRRVQRFIPAGIKTIFLAGDMMKYYNYCKGCRFDRSFTNNGKP